MKRPQKGSTPRQYAYATKRLNPGPAESKKEMALLVGFAPSVANNVKNKIENTEGYKNAVIELATKSNNLLLAAITEFEARGLSGFSNADLTKALNAITGAWTQIEKVRAPNQMKTPEGNRLRGVFTRRVETQTAVITSDTQNIPTGEEPASATQTTQEAQEATPVSHIDLDF